MIVNGVLCCTIHPYITILSSLLFLVFVGISCIVSNEIEKSDSSLTTFRYVVSSNDDPKCMAISLFCGNLLVSYASLFDANTNTEVHFSIDFDKCGIINYSLLNPYISSGILIK